MAAKLKAGGSESEPMAKTLRKMPINHGTDTVVVHLRDLTPDPSNRRRHNPRNIGMITDALQRVGAARSIVIDEHGTVLAGNGVLEAAADAGIDRVQVVDTDGSTIVAVRRRGLTEAQKRDLAISDNRAAELAEWNAAQLQADLSAGLTLQQWFSDEEQAAIFSRSAAGTIDDMARNGDDASAEGDDEPAVDGDYQSFTCPLSADQERIVRAAIRKAKTVFEVETTGRALALALDAWMNGQNQ